jgi:hypothetical protein
MQSIGNPGGAARTPAWGNIADQVAKLGGTATVFNGLDGTGGYALVGQSGMDFPPAEASQPLTKEPGRLQGLLARSMNSNYGPLFGDPKAPVNDALVQLANEPTTTFPSFNTKSQLSEPLMSGTRYSTLSVQPLPSAIAPGATLTIGGAVGPFQTVTVGSEGAAADATTVPVDSFIASANHAAGTSVETKGTAAAETYLGKTIMKVCPETDPTCDVRAQYYLKYKSAWGTSILHNLGDRKAFPCPDDPSKLRFTAAECELVRVQITKEVSDLARVQNYLDQLQKPFGPNVQAALIDVNTIATRIRTQVAAPMTSDAPSQAFEMMSYIVKLGAFLPPPASTVSAGMGAAFSLVAYFSKPDGSPNLLGPRLMEKVSELTDDTVNRYLAASSQLEVLGRIVVSDYGKLTTMASKVDSDPSWVLPPDLASAVAPLRLAADQYFYQSLLPVAFHLVPLAPPPPAGPATAKDFYCSNVEGQREVYSHPFQEEPEGGWDSEIVGFRNDGTPILRVVALSSGPLNKFHEGVPGKDLVDPLFRGSDDAQGPGYGMYKAELYLPRYFSFSNAFVQNSRC